MRVLLRHSDKIPDVFLHHKISQRYYGSFFFFPPRILNIIDIIRKEFTENMTEEKNKEKKQKKKNETVSVQEKACARERRYQKTEKTLWMA